eukprot:jgi/Undpi1/11251/HiC_scaffold_30.g13549.m1
MHPARNEGKPRNMYTPYYGVRKKTGADGVFREAATYEERASEEEEEKEEGDLRRERWERREEGRQPCWVHGVARATATRILSRTCSEAASSMSAAAPATSQDYIPDLVGLTKENLDKDDESLLSSGKVTLKTGDGWKGWAEHGPYDAIHVGAAAETIPEDLVSQLKVGGRMVVPVGPQSSSQMLVQVDRTKDTGPISESYTTESLMAVVYVPLVNT